MKRSNYIFESVLIAITAVFGLIAFFSMDTIFLGALWLIVLGAMQVIHSLVLGVNYWSVKAIQKSIIIYWCGVVLNFIIMFIGNTATISNNTEIITILIFPLLLALYLWYITYAYRLKPVSEEPLDSV